MVVKTGRQIVLRQCGEEFSAEKWYLASDIDKRVEFYKKYKKEKELLMSEETRVFLVWIHLHNEGDFKTQQELDDSYEEWLFNFCFSNLDKDFEEMIK